MDESSGVIGIGIILLVVALVAFGWMGLRDQPAEGIDRPVAVEGGADPLGHDLSHAKHGHEGHPLGSDQSGAFAWWPLGRRATLGVLGLFYLGGLFRLRPRAIRAKRLGATDAQAALAALWSFALSPVVVPWIAIHGGLSALGRALTSEPGAEGRGGHESRKSRGANDLD